MTIKLDEHGQPIWGNRAANTTRKRSYSEQLAREEKQAAKRSTRLQRPHSRHWPRNRVSPWLRSSGI
jgi:hypothetical protein